MDRFISILIVAFFAKCLASNRGVYKIPLASPRRYKIDVVSSETNPNKPVMFTHAESPVWDAKRQALLFVDVWQQNVHLLHYTTGKIETKHINYGQVNVVSLVANSRRLLVAVRSSLYLMDWDVVGDDSLRLLATVDVGQPDNVINEGKADSEGRFWAGTKGPQTGDDVLPDKATLYSFDQSRDFSRPRAQLRPVSISNGIVWSLNNTVMYYVDSPTQRIVAFDYDPVKGDISNQRTIIDISNYGYEDVIPDGMTIDSDGHLWVALMFAGTVLHINPDMRQVIYGYKMPVTRVTSVCWGGPNLDEMFVTTAKDNQEESLEPLAGAIFTIRDTGSKGVVPNVVRIDNAESY